MFFQEVKRACEVLRSLALFIIIGLSFAACSSSPTDMRTLVPEDTLVYLETNDLGKTLAGLTQSKAFAEAAKSTPDFSALNGMQTAVAVTGFEAFENKVTAENSVLNFQPRFVAVADTHTWNRYTLSFVEEKLGEFVNQTYGGEVTLERTDDAGGASFVWTSSDGRKVFAFVSGSRIFFSNDESALGKARAVARGEAESLAKNASLAKMRETATNAVAFGYVSPDGLAQIANFAGVSTAIEATEDEDGRSFIARVLPQVLRGTIREMFWVANITEKGIEDKYSAPLTPESASVLKETIVPGAPVNPAGVEFLPADVSSVTRYNLKDPQIAWRSLLLVAGKNTDPASGNVIVAFSGSLLDPYGVADAESFLSSIDSDIWTAAFDADGDKTVAICVVKDAAKVRQSINEIDFKKVPEKIENTDVWKSADGEIAAAFVENRLILGDPESVTKCLAAKVNGQNFTKNPAWGAFAENGAVAISFGKAQTDRLVNVLAGKKAENLQMMTSFTTETRVNAAGIERKTTSPFGLIGQIIEQFDD